MPAPSARAEAVVGTRNDVMQETRPDRPESPDERMQRRRARRWKRRARMVGPLLGIPLLLLTLGLSVDLIEYRPQEKGEKLSDRPLPPAVLEEQRRRAIPLRRAISTSSVTTASPTPSFEAPAVAHGRAAPGVRYDPRSLDPLGERFESDRLDFEASRIDAASPTRRAPTPPEVLHGPR